jgi:hypothetical protein
MANKVTLQFESNGIMSIPLTNGTVYYERRFQFPYVWAEVYDSDNQYEGIVFHSFFLPRCCGIKTETVITRTPRKTFRQLIQQRNGFMEVGDPLINDVTLVVEEYDKNPFNSD